MALKAIAFLFGLTAFALADEATTNSFFHWDQTTEGIFTIQTTWPSSYPTSLPTACTDWPREGGFGCLTESPTGSEWHSWSIHNTWSGHSWSGHSWSGLQSWSDWTTVTTTVPAAATTVSVVSEITSTPSVIETFSILSISNSTVLSKTPTPTVPTTLTSGSTTQSATAPAGTGAAGMVYPHVLGAVAGGAVAGLMLAV
ncbi:uncharacterized protein BDZ99DRAFT_94915 [Mytilinidion resinicola]|uniref:GPI anchored protein n=1 Tax=Mytilinidion resinicola TaxID=574789 RepID=A0A6A6YCJ9_9PEZI|nr:uncharacterized protein BDZ99DRAFT_94915 [Mytilinidion resinicola]KAF2806430.1 hypothetical protein BDZ99DRAFT_94915 [Mytilinidion resinicola]